MNWLSREVGKLHNSLVDLKAAQVIDMMPSHGPLAMALWGQTRTPMSGIFFVNNEHDERFMLGGIDNHVMKLQAIEGHVLAKSDAKIENIKKYFGNTMFGNLFDNNEGAADDEEDDAALSSADSDDENGEISDE